MSLLRNLNDIPAKYRSIFSSIKQFNRVQSEVFDDVFQTGEFWTCVFFCLPLTSEQFIFNCKINENREAHCC